MTVSFDPPLDLQTIRIVRAIADTGTITGAARLLGYSQPAVSQHVQRAEARLNVPLVTRVAARCDSPRRARCSPATH